MEVLAVLFLVGCFYIARDTARGTARSLGARRSSARQAAAARGGRASTAHVTRRAARQATAGWWAGELRHGLPTVRHGLAAGRADHRLAMTEAEHARRQREAGHSARIARLRAEIEHYQLAMEAIGMLHERQRDAAKCTCSVPPDGNPDHAPVTDRNCPEHGQAGPRQGPPNLGRQLRDLIGKLQRERGQPPEVRPEGTCHCGALLRGYDHCPCCGCEQFEATCDHVCPQPAGDPWGHGFTHDHDKEPDPAPAGPESNGKDGGPVTTGTSGTGDFNYDNSVALADRLITTAEQAVSSRELDDAQALADGLGGMISGDSEVLSDAADVVSACAAIQQGGKQLQEAAAALKDTLTRKYGPVQEAKDASGEELPEKQFMEH